MRIAADTAILVRAHSKASGPSRELLTAVRKSGARLVLSPFLLAEVERVLRYPRLQALYRLTAEVIHEYVKRLESLADIVIPAEGPPIVLQDPDDDPSCTLRSPDTPMFSARGTGIAMSRMCWPFVRATGSGSWTTWLS